MGTKSLPGQRHPGGVPWVNSALWCGGSPVRNPGGTPIFWPLPFRGDRLETKKGARELGLMTLFSQKFLINPVWKNYQNISWKNCHSASPCYDFIKASNFFDGPQHWVHEALKMATILRACLDQFDTKSMHNRNILSLSHHQVMDMQSYWFGTPNQIEHVLCAISQWLHFLGKNNNNNNVLVSIPKLIIWETKKIHAGRFPKCLYSKHSESYWSKHEYLNILHILINNSRTTGP